MEFKEKKHFLSHIELTQILGGKINSQFALRTITKKKCLNEESNF